MDKNICPKCSTENEAEYAYCKNCGTSLGGMPEPEREPKQNPYSGQAYSQPQRPQQPYTPPVYVQTPPTNEYTAEDTIDGIPVSDMTTFVGKKSNVVIPKFMKIQILGSKSAWCWPAAIWSFCLGPIGAAIWFMYRKMYKLAIIFAAVAIAFSAVTYAIEPPNESALNMDVGSTETFNALLEEILDEEEELTLSDYILSWIGIVVSIATITVTGIYGWYWYKQHSVNKIYSYRASNPDHRYYQFALCSMGGTSVGPAILMFFIYAIADTTLGEIFARILGGA